MKNQDIISRFIELAAASCSSFTEDIAIGIEQQLRHEFGGAGVDYIAKTPASQRKSREEKEAALDEVKRSGRVRAAAERHGISRAALYRMLKR